MRCEKEESRMVPRFVAQGSSNTGLSFTKLEDYKINWFGEHEGDRFK